MENMAMKRAARSKKGQFYILMALIVVIEMFALAYPLQKLKGPGKDPNYLAENYMTEAKFVVDSAIINTNVADMQLDNFTAGFMAYAQAKDPSFTLVYVLAIPNNIAIRNYGAGKFEVYQWNEDDITGQTYIGSLDMHDNMTIGRLDYTKLVKGGNEYTFKTPEEKYKVQALFVTE